jgi:hypothetical protein
VAAQHYLATRQEMARALQSSLDREQRLGRPRVAGPSGPSAGHGNCVRGSFPGPDRRSTSPSGACARVHVFTKGTRYRRSLSRRVTRMLLGRFAPGNTCGTGACCPSNTSATGAIRPSNMAVTGANRTRYIPCNLVNEGFFHGLPVSPTAPKTSKHRVLRVLRIKHPPA